MVELIYVCTAIMCPESIQTYGVYLPPGTTLTSAHYAGRELMSFCIEVGESGGRARVVRWTDKKIVFEVTPDVRVCNKEELSS